MVNLKFWKWGKDKDKNEITLSNDFEIKKVIKGDDDTILKNYTLKDIKKLEAAVKKQDIDNKDLTTLNNVLIDSYWNPQKESIMAETLGMKDDPKLYKEKFLAAGGIIPEYDKKSVAVIELEKEAKKLEDKTSSS